MMFSKWIKVPLAASLAAEVGALLQAETGVDPQVAAFRELAARQRMLSCLTHLECQQ